MHVSLARTSRPTGVQRRGCARRVVLCAVSVVVIACLLLAILGWRPAFIVQREGEIIVAALCRYKEEQGLWPLRISGSSPRKLMLLGRMPV